MHYFVLEQDERSKPSLVINASANDVLEGSSLYVREELEVVFIDFVEEPQPIVSNRMKQLLELYESRLAWTPVVLTAKEAKRQELYWYLQPSEREVLSDKSKRDRLGNVTTVVLDGNRLQQERLFCAGGRIIIQLDVAESLLRRAYTGMRLISVEVDHRSSN